MDLKKIFVFNLKKLRKIEGLSQMKLAEKCDTDASYIGQIEIGRRFPSIELIEKIASALKVEPYRFFMDESSNDCEELDETINFLTKLPNSIRLDMIKRLNTAICDCIHQTLSP
jgi:transcriptional regulator with XRE-family HTH domain